MTFEDLLRESIPQLNQSIVNRSRRRFGSLVQQAVIEKRSDIAVEVYEQTLALPQTETEHQLLIDGVQLNGLWLAGNENFIICFKGTVAHLLKVLNPKEYERGSVLFYRLMEHEWNEFISRFELRTVDKKKFMIMPFYPATLENIKTLTVAEGQQLYAQIGSAIKSFHEINMNHMDIKPANICCRENGNFVLIDFGSATTVGHTSESTVVYVPKDFQPRDRRNPTNKFIAENRNDWMMLGMTIAEKVYGLNVGGPADPPTIAELVQILQEHNAFGELIDLMKSY